MIALAGAHVRHGSNPVRNAVRRNQRNAEDDIRAGSPRGRRVRREASPLEGGACYPSLAPINPAAAFECSHIARTETSVLRTSVRGISALLYHNGAKNAVHPLLSRSWQRAW